MALRVTLSVARRAKSNGSRCFLEPTLAVAYATPTAGDTPATPPECKTCKSFWSVAIESIALFFRFVSPASSAGVGFYHPIYLVSSVIILYFMINKRSEFMLFKPCVGVLLFFQHCY